MNDGDNKYDANSGLAPGPAAQRAIELWAQRDDASEADLLAAIRAEDDGNSRRRHGAAGSDVQQPAEGDTDVEMTEDAVRSAAAGTPSRAGSSAEQAAPSSGQAVTTPDAREPAEPQHADSAASGPAAPSDGQPRARGERIRTAQDTGPKRQRAAKRARTTTEN